MAVSSAAPPVGGRAARAVLFVHLALGPVLFSTATVDTFEYPKVAALKLTAIALLGLGAAGLARLAAADRAVRLRALVAEPIALGACALGASALLSTLFSINPLLSFRGSYESFAGLQTLLSYLVLFFAARSACEKDADARRLLLAAVIGGVAAAGYAAAQAAGLDPLAWRQVAAFAGSPRPFGTMGHANHLAALLVMTLPLALVATPRARWSALAIVPLFLAVIVLARSRAAWLALAGLAALGVLVARRSPARAAFARLAPAPAALTLLLALALLYSSPGLAQSLWARVESLGEAGGRREIWRAALFVFTEHPLLGSGLDTLRLVYPAHRSVELWESGDWNVTPTRAHSEPLHVLATQGLVGGLAGLAFALALLRSAARVLRAADGTPLRAAVAAGALAFSIQSCFSFTTAATGGLFAVLAGLLSRWDATPTNAPRAASRAPAGWAAALACAAAAHVAVLTPLRADLACRRGIDRAADAREGLSGFERALALERDEPFYWTRLGLHAQHVAARLAAAERRPLLERARAAFERARELVPQDAYAHMHLARLLADFAAQRLARAADVFALCETAIAMDPRNAYFYLAATDAAIVVGDRARVRDFAERGVRLYPRFAPLRMHLGHLALDEGRTEDAVRMLRAAFYGDWHGKEADRSRTAASLSIALRRQGALEEGCRYAEYAVTYDPGSTRARGAFAGCPQAASRGAETR